MRLKVLSILFGICSFATSIQYDCSGSKSYHTPATDEFLLSIFNLSSIDLLDGPSHLSTAPTKARTTSLTEAEVKYYNYFSTSVYCPYTFPNLTCCYCSEFSSTVTYLKIFTNARYDTMASFTLHPEKAEIVLTFRGSVAILNFVIDFTLLPVTTHPRIQLHLGFYLSLMSIYNDIVRELHKLTKDNPSYRVVITGHSLGGSMGSLFLFFMTQLKQFPKTKYVLVTYGQPRTGNKGFADYMNGLSIPMARVVARGDLACHIIPMSIFGLFPALFGMYFVHHGQEVWINGRETKFCSKTVYEDPTCSNSMGPGYTHLDHMQYFDADYTACYSLEGTNLLNLPVDQKPITYIPPMPTKMHSFLSPVVRGGYQGLLPLL